MIKEAKKKSEVVKPRVVPIEEASTCANCKFFADNRTEMWDAAACVRQPPAVVANGTRHAPPIAKYPRVKAKWSCGEFKRGAPIVVISETVSSNV